MIFDIICNQFLSEKGSKMIHKYLSIDINQRKMKRSSIL
jgi:hypothetical protein